MRQSLTFALTALVLLQARDVAVTLHAATADCVATTVTALAEADTWIAESVTSSMGADALLKVEANVASGNARALIRFAMPRVPVECVVESARLRVYTPAGSDGSRLEAALIGSGWTEAGVLWDTQPATTGAAAQAWSTDGYLRWNVTEQVRAIYESGVNHGFMIRDRAEGTDAGDLHGFHSREKGEDPPHLVIRFAAPVMGELPPPAPPIPAIVRCGQVLTESTLVANDLLECQGDGLVIGAPRIIVDLDGRTIDGVGLGAGIHNDGFAGVTIRNGRVEDFDHGVRLLPDSSQNVIEHLYLRLNQVAAIELFEAPEGIVRENVLDQNGGGIDLINGTSRVLVSGNVVTANGGPGVLLRDADGNWLEHNRITGGGDLGIGLEHASGNTLLSNVIAGNSDGGIELEAGSNANRIERNVVTESGDSGILVSDSDHNQLIGNTSHRMSDSGIGLNNANDTLVSDNDVRFNSDGLQVEGSRNRILLNNASQTSGNGIELAPGAFENHVFFNTANANASAGIFVEGDAPPGLGNLLERNTASGNLVAGILVANGRHVLAANTVRNNQGWGISAYDSVDGGGNVASGNKEQSQCSGVTCRTEWVEPETAIDAGPPAVTTSSSVVVAFSANEPATFRCSLDGGAFVSCTTPRQITALAPGPHQFRVAATDLAGNVDATPAAISWIVEVDPNAPPPPPIVECGDPLTLTAVADAWVDQNSPSSNGGVDTSLRVRSRGPTGNRRALLRFAIPPAPAGCQVTSGVLRLYADSARSGRTLQAFALAAEWTERGVTWANQPAATGAPAATVSGTGYREWNVAAQLEAMFEIGTSFGFLVRDAVENQDANQVFRSREWDSRRPQLVISFGPK